MAESSAPAPWLGLGCARAVRTDRIEQTMRRDQVDLRALGNLVPEGPSDRVDVMLEQR